MNKNADKPVKTERGWEIADDQGVLESEAASIVYATKLAAQAAIEAAEIAMREWGMERHSD